MKTFNLPSYGLEIEVTNNGGGVLVKGFDIPCIRKFSNDYRIAFDALESIILAHACAGIDIADPRYLEGIETSVDAILNNLD